METLSSEEQRQDQQGQQDVHSEHYLQRLREQTLMASSFGARRPGIHIHFNSNGLSSTSPFASPPSVRIDRLQPQLIAAQRIVPLPQNVLIPALRPLEPQPLPNQDDGQDSADKDDNGHETTVTHLNSKQSPLPNKNICTATEETAVDAKLLKAFECAICFEYMITPVGCGSCQTRFCQTCLERVLHQENSNNNTHTLNRARCPNCRSFFVSSDISVDTQLREKIQNCTETVPCPYRGCNQRFTISTLKAHESQCEYLRMRCRYADWGCQWMGTKRDLFRHHEKNECLFRKELGVLVHKFRLSEWQNWHVLHYLQSQIEECQRLSMQNRQMILHRIQCNAGNILDVLSLAYTATCFPRKFAGGGWGPMIGIEGPRSLVCNQLFLLPQLAIIARVAFDGLQLFPRFFHTLFTNEDSTILWQLLDAILLSFITSILGLLFLACCFIDIKSPHDWTLFNVRDIIVGQPFLRDIAASCMAMAVFSWMEFFGPIRGIMIWYFTAIVTIFYSSFIACMIEKVTNSANLVKASRASSIAIFGLRYGCLVSMCNFIPSVGAFFVLRAIATTTTKFPSGACAEEDTDCFLSRFTHGHSIIGAVAFLALSVGQARIGLTMQPLIEIVVVVLALAIINANINFFLHLGKKLGEINYNTIACSSINIMGGLTASPAIAPTLRPTPVGVSVFAICVSLMISVFTM